MSAVNNATINASSNGGDVYVSVDQNIDQKGYPMGDATNNAAITATSNGGDVSVGLSQNISQESRPAWPWHPKPFEPFCYAHKPRFF